MLREWLGSGGLGTVLHLARRIIAFTLAAEVAGAIVLSFAFRSELDGPLALWWGLFHSISAFNNAGFDPIGGFHSLVPFNQRPEIVLLMSPGAERRGSLAVTSSGYPG